MAQHPIRMLGTDDHKTSIQVRIGIKNVTFFLQHQWYDRTQKDLRKWIADGWYNHAVSNLVQRSDYVEYEGHNYQPKSVKVKPAEPWNRGSVTLQIEKEAYMSRNAPIPANAVKYPDDEHTWTLIAPAAQNGLEYQGQRYWHKSEDDAIKYAGVLYNMNGEAHFELAVVQVTQIIAPKPKVELMSKTIGTKIGSLTNNSESSQQ